LRLFSLCLLQSDPPKVQRSEGAGRGALLSDIQKGTRLKKVTQVKDRSAPVFDSELKSISFTEAQFSIQNPMM